MSKLINENIQGYRVRVDELIKDLHELTIRIENVELAKTLSDLRNRVHEPFMFVIVGEVKAGKSSFVNALLATGKEVAKVAPQPMTDTIQQIIYGEKEEVIQLKPQLKKILLPVDILKEIAIVDTPGTNTIIEHHQEITEGFIPASDLIVFVFEAKNPYRQSAWDFFDYIHADWRRKIIFVLQQKDLMPEDDLAVNVNGVRENAQKKGISEPNVFAVSAKQEIEGQHDISGFQEIRSYIAENITGGKAPGLKLVNTIDTAVNISERIEKGLALRRKQWETDVAFREDIKETLDSQEVNSAKQVDLLVENLIAGYDRITLQKEKELKEGLSFFTLLRKSFASIFNRKASAKDWLESLAKSLETDLTKILKDKLDDGVLNLADSVQQMAKLIDLKIRSSETILKNDHELFSNIAERRTNVLRDLQETFANFINQSENFTDEDLFPDKKALSPNLAAGSGIAVIGIIIATVTNGMVFDITGGILSTIGLLFAGVSTRIQRRKVIDGFQKEIAKGRTQIQQEVDQKLKAYIRNLKGRIDTNFTRFDDLIKKEETQINKLEGELAEVSGAFSKIAAELRGSKAGTERSGDGERE